MSEEWKNLWGKTDSATEDYKVTIPEEYYQLMNWEYDGLPCVAVLNLALIKFEPKIVFSWNLSVIIDFENLIDNGMPSLDEQQIVDSFCDKLNEEIKAGGNALFLIRETWNGTRRMVWRVYDPEIAHKHLQYIIEYKQHPREFEYRMEEDPYWEEAKWYFEQLQP